MIWRNNLRLICLVLFISLGATNTGVAQSSALELWPETDIWYRINPSWRLSSFISLTKNVESKYREMNIFVQADYAWGHTKRTITARLMDDSKAQIVKSWMVRGGGMEGWSLGDHADNYTEDMAFAEFHKRIPLKRNVLLSQRLRTDFRWVGQEPDYSYRIRYRIMVEKEYESGRKSIVPYFNVEPYWDSRYDAVNRVRIVGGATLAWTSNMALEGDITYQYDSKSSVTNLYAINIILHLFFEKKQSHK